MSTGEPASEAVRRAREAALESLRYLHTGAQRVVPPRPRVEISSRRNLDARLRRDEPRLGRA